MHFAVLIKGLDNIWYQGYHFYEEFFATDKPESEPTITHKVFETNSGGIAHYGKSLFSVLQEFFASINKTFILAGGLRTRLSFYQV